MRVFAIGIEHPFGVTVQRPQHTNARVHHEVAAFRGADQAGHRRLPFLESLLGLRQFHDVVGGILERDELATAGQRYRIVEGPLPARFWPDGQRRIPSTA
jgi:hypothetical protein